MTHGNTAKNTVPGLRRHGALGLATTGLDQALTLLHADARPEALSGMARFGILGHRRLGLSMPAMRRVAKALGRDHALALALWNSLPMRCGS